MVYPRRSSYGIFVRFRRSRLALRRGVTRLEDALAIAEQLRANRFHDRGDIFVVKEPEGTIVELAHRAIAPLPAEAHAIPLHDEAASDPEPRVPAESLLHDGVASAPPSAPMEPAFEPPSDPGSDDDGSATSDDSAPCPTLPAVPLGTTSNGMLYASSPRARVAAPSAMTGAPASVLRPAGKKGTTPVREVETILLLSERLEHFRHSIDRAHAAQERFDRAFSAAEGAMRTREGSLPDALLRNQKRLGVVRALVAQSMDSFERVTSLLERRLEAVWADATTRAPAS